VVSGTILTAAALILYAARLDRGEAIARGVALAVVIPGGVGLVWAERALDRPWRELSLPRSVRFWSVLAVTLLSVPVAMAVPPLARALHVAPISLADAGLALTAVVAAILWRVRGVRSVRTRPSPGSPAGGLPSRHAEPP
jgi:hypothetical protein